VVVDARPVTSLQVGSRQAFLGVLGVKEEGKPFDLRAEPALQPLGPGEADVAERSGVVAPDGDGQRVHGSRLREGRTESRSPGFLTTVSAADPAPGDEAQAEEMAALYEESGDARIRALSARYSKRDRTVYELMDQSESAGEEADAIAAELGAESCTGDPPGPYSTIDGLAAVRWGERASTFCSERDRAYMRLRPTDAARFEAVTRRWLRQMRALEPPDEYAGEIERFLDLYVASSQAQRDAEAAFDRGDIAAGERLNDKGNRLITRSAEVMYDVGFAIGFERFCSARPA
jgi:hypothetical protein